MRKFAFIANLVFATLGLMALASTPLDVAVAHEAHRMECSKTNINAVNADIQSMSDGDAKTTAVKEMEMANDMMAKKDMTSCATHLLNAIEATEE